MKFIIENWDIILQIVTGVVTVASIIAKLTKTEVDDNFWGKFLMAIDKVALNNKPTELKK